MNPCPENWEKEIENISLLADIQYKVEACLDVYAVYTHY